MKLLSLAACVLCMLFFAKAAFCGSVDVDKPIADDAQGAYESDTDVSEPEIENAEAEDTYEADSESVRLSVKRSNDRETLRRVYEEDRAVVEDDDAKVEASDEPYEDSEDLSDEDVGLQGDE